MTLGLFSQRTRSGSDSPLVEPEKNMIMLGSLFSLFGKLNIRQFPFQLSF